MQTTTPTQQKIELSLQEASDVAKGLVEKSGTVTEKISDAIIKNSNSIQGMLDKLLQKRGVITQKELDELDEKVKEAKMTYLKTESKEAVKRTILFVSVAVVAFGALWFFTRKKQAA